MESAIRTGLPALFLVRQVFCLFKLRIGVAIALAALAGWAVTPGAALSAAQVAVLALAVLVSSAAAGAFNQYAERDLDLRMGRTRKRPFVTGALRHSPAWLWVIAAMIAGATAAAWFWLNAMSALFVFLGAFTYGVVYTVWLKRRTWLNIVIGGLAGSFAVLAGAAAADPALSAVPLLLAVVLFLWTPPHFWSLAIAYRRDYAAAGVPMLPVVVGDALSARMILMHTLTLVALSLVPGALGAGPIYMVCAVAGGAWFVWKSVALTRAPGPQAAMSNFHASLAQLSLLLAGAIVDGVLF